MAATAQLAEPTTTQEQVDDLLLEVLPRQGGWDDEAYLWLTDHTNRLIELSDGRLEVLPMPTLKHQALLKYLFLAFVAFLEPLGGAVYFAPLRLRLPTGKFREPDLLLLRDAADPRSQNRYWLGADLVLEVVSEDNPQRDYDRKRRDYAEAAIPEYWIVDGGRQTVTVLRLQDGAYVEHGVFGVGATATSPLLPGFQVDVTALFATR